MPFHNIEIAEIFNKLANLLEIQGANPFRVRAYRNAAFTIRGLTKNVSQLIADDEDLTELPGIGKDLADKIKIIVKTGELPLLKQVEKQIPPFLNELMRIEGLGPKRIKIIYDKLKIKSIDQLTQAIEKGRLQKIKGFGKKTEEKILVGLKQISQHTKGHLLAYIVPIVESLITYLNLANPLHIVCCGSFRRCKETVNDIDIVVISNKNMNIMEHFVKYEEVAAILAKGPTRATVRLHSGVQVDLRVVPKKSYGSALLYFTGSKEHNIALRMLALKQHLKLNEYGVFKKNKWIAGRTEQDIYKLLKLQYIEPELRENRDEIKAARDNELPHLISLNDIKGDLHCHTNATDGTADLESIAKVAEELGYEYIAITDHSQHLAFTHGLTKKTLLDQIRTIDKLNGKLKKLVILKSIEVDILEDGSLDLPNSILKELDLTVCSIHSYFNLSPKKQTERLIRAMDNPYFNILGHPTGRLIFKREAYAVDIEKIILAAKERGLILELNAQPNRLDLNDIHCKMAKELGVKIAISTDAHGLGQLFFMNYGILQARRGWIEKNDVINTRSLVDLKKLLQRN